MKKEKQLLKSFVSKILEKLRKLNSLSLTNANTSAIVNGQQKLNTGDCNSPSQDKKSMKSKYLNSQVMNKEKISQTQSYFNSNSNNSNTNGSSSTYANNVSNNN